MRLIIPTAYFNKAIKKLIYEPDFTSNNKLGRRSVI